ncbi:MAG: c-type cytochrome [Phycisphaerales bacterium]
MSSDRAPSSAATLAIVSIAFALVVTVVAVMSVFRSGPPQAPTQVAATVPDVAPPRAQAQPIAIPPDPQPSWIWSDEKDQTATLVRELDLPARTRCEARIACDNHGELFVNDKSAGRADEWAQATSIDLTPLLQPGANKFRVEARNDDGPAAVLIELRIVRPDGSRTVEGSGARWTTGGGKPARVVAKLGDAPWGMIEGIGEGDINRSIRVPDGFVCELVCAIPHKLGSMVALAAARDGTLVASGQGTGLVRIDPCPPGGDPTTTSIKPIDLPIGGAQGLVYRGDVLYAVVNSRIGQGMGLYRLPDENHDGIPDRVELLRAFSGEPSEHGPHSVVVGPDGDLYVVCGNHVGIPSPEASRLSRRWNEDLLLPRMWDPNGHAVGILAPGGWICRTDPDGKSWELVAAGMRNSYDIAFSPEGELFTFDADMEWDMGAPWYRPTRVLHCVSGAEFGWRSGSGKWPWWFADSLPATVDIGPGSPTGILFGTDLAFPAPWRNALLLCDWTFGTIHAVMLEPSGASFTGRREVFLTGKPLPLTDAVASPHDGALYFAIGGRGAASSIYRVRWTGTPAPKPAPATAEAAARAQRRALEQYHRDDAPASAIDEAWPMLGSSDRFLRWAARTVLEHQPPDRWLDRALAEPNTLARLEGAVAAARCADAAAQPKILAALGALDWDKLSVEERRMLLRATELTLIRQGMPEGDARTALVRRLDAHYPCDDFAANRDLCDLLVALGSRTVVARAVPLLERTDPEAERFDEALLRRSDSYGSVILRMAAQAPQREQVHVATSLRNATEGWTDDLRRRYFGWFRRMQRTSGGNSFAGFLEQSRKDALSHVPEQERAQFDRLSREDEVVARDIPVAEGPGRHWTVEEVAALAAAKPGTRNFARGEKMFRAAQCAMCHRFATNTTTGGGPDLTGVGNRFGPREMAESIVEPSRVISDQYRMTEFELSDGSIAVGRLVAEDATHAHIVENLLARDAIRDIELKSIVARRPSSVSPMMAGLVDSLSPNELADLLAYLQSGGDPSAPMFTGGNR